MAGFTSEQAQLQLDAWLAASLAVSQGQSYSIAGRSLTRVNAEHIQGMIDYWSRKLNEIKAKTSGRRRTRYVVPMT
jgi:hypothetical protein